MNLLPDNVDWSSDPYWRSRRFSPAQLLIHDVRLASNPYSPSHSNFLEIFETLPSTLLPSLQSRDYLSQAFISEQFTTNYTERARLDTNAREYGWMNCLRSKGVQKAIDDPADLRKCRWIHISSKFPEYLEGVLFAMSDWSRPNAGHSIVSSVRHLSQCIQQNERFSKHGKFFTPFFEPLSEAKIGGPMIISVPFLDWGITGPSPELRFQVDPREKFMSSRSSSHFLRSILQHFYRLEDTKQRESQQVFTKHKPWLTDRDLDLKVRRWYGHYPNALNVDELWILIIDARHIVTFSSNQTWKARWPPQQFPSRVAEISFRSIRSIFLDGDESADYTSYTHAIACLSGGLGLMHRNFWSDIQLCLTDRYVGFLSHLQYQLLRSPNLNLVQELMQVQDELNIIVQLMQQQLDLVNHIQDEWILDGIPVASPSRSRATSVSGYDGRHVSPPPPFVTRGARLSFKNVDNSNISDPIKQVIDNLRRELTDLKQVSDNCSNLVTRTIQLVNIRLEDHGKILLVFTTITIIFLPLSFAATYLGMNTSDIRNLESTQRIFWIYAVPVTVIIVALTTVFASFGPQLWQYYFNWTNKREEQNSSSRNLISHTLIQPKYNPGEKVESFRVIGGGI